MSAFNKLFSSFDGGRWLRKAFNPEGVDEEVNGLPDANIAACCTLNYVSKHDVPIPKSLMANAAQNSAYDCSVYLFHDPVILGSCASYPSGTSDLAEAEMEFRFWTPIIQVTDNSKFYAPRTTKQFLNNQIPGNTINEKRKYLTDNAQRYRIIYGASKLIPLCSEDYNSGAMSICQSLMSPESLGTKECILGTQDYKSNNVAVDANSSSPYAGMVARMNNDLNAIKHEEMPAFVLTATDFPNPEDIIQYPNAYYDRYNAGGYVPYKMLNAFDCKFISTESKCQLRTPFWVTGAAYTVDDVFGGSYSAADGQYQNVTWNELTFNEEKQRFEDVDHIPADNDYLPITAYLIHCTSYYGIPFDYVIFTRYISDNHQHPIPGTSQVLLKLPKNCTPYGAHYTSSYTISISSTTQNAESVISSLAIFGHTNAAKYTTQIPGPYIVNDFTTITQNVISIHCTSVNNSASLQIYLRLGMELQSTGNSAFSTIRHTSPPYDEEALKSYTRVMQGMKDALPGDAITPGGQEAYYAYIAEQLSNFVRTYYTNNGAHFTGKASVK